MLRKELQSAVCYSAIRLMVVFKVLFCDFYIWYVVLYELVCLFMRYVTDGEKFRLYFFNVLAVPLFAGLIGDTDVVQDCII